MILLGSPCAPYQADLTELLRHVHIRGVTLKGALAGAPGPGAGQHSVEGNLAWLLDLIASDALKVGPLVLHTVRPADVQAAYDGHLDDPDSYLGTIIDWTGEH